MPPCCASSPRQYGDNLAAVFAGVVSVWVSRKSAQKIEAREVEPTAYGSEPAAVFKLRGPLFFGSW